MKILAMGVVTEFNTFTKIYLCFFVQYDYDAVPAIPPEIVLFPNWFWFNIYEISSWARAILVPLSICYAKKLFKKIPALQLWRKMLSMLFETGHPWITFKDACNVRSPQSHIGSVHSSNLCTEITLNTSESEIAVCNLGSVNLLAHMKKMGKGENGNYELDHPKLRATIKTAMRMLDNVIDINYYAVAKARNANLKHRPVGLGIMSFQDCLHLLQHPYASDGAMSFADRSMEAVCYYAYWASTELDEERGTRGNRAYYFAVPPQAMPVLVEQRAGVGLRLPQQPFDRAAAVVVRQDLGHDSLTDRTVLDRLERHERTGHAERTDHLRGERRCVRAVAARNQCL